MMYVCCLERSGAEVAECRVTAARVVEEVEIVADVRTQGREVAVGVAMDSFFLERREEALDACVVVTAARRAHTPRDACGVKAFAKNSA